MFFARDPGQRFSFDYLNIDFTRQFAHDLHFIDLRKLLQAIVHAAQIDRENVFALMQIGHFQDLFALQSAIGLCFNRGQLIIRIVEKQAARCLPAAEIKSDDECDQ